MSDPLKYFKIEVTELLETLHHASLELDCEKTFASSLAELQRAAHSLKGSSRLVEMFHIGDLAHKLEDSLAKLCTKNRVPSESEITALHSELEVLDQTIKKILEPAISTKQDEPQKEGAFKKTNSSSISTKTKKSEDDRYTRIASCTVDEIGRCAGELIELSNKAEHLQNALKFISKQVHLEEVSDTVPAFRELNSCLESLLPLGKKLQSLSLAARLVPVETESYRFKKIVRSTALSIGKKVDFVVNGEEHTIDRFVLQQMIEPIAHLLRNAVVHGIETPEERSKVGKHRTGKISLSFERKGELLSIVVEDDGAGIDTKKIVGATSLQEASELIFQSGFSTEPKISQLAGRGIGLDVVRSSVHELRGSIHVESEAGYFCRFRICLPSDINVLEALVLEVAGQELMLPLGSVIATYICKREEVFMFQGQDAILFNERPIKLYSLAEILKDITSNAIGLAENELRFFKSSSQSMPKSTSDSKFHLVILQGLQEQLAVTVDSIKQKRKVMVRSVGPLLKDSDILAGAAIMNNGLPSFLLDVPNLAKYASLHSQASIFSHSTKESKSPTVLVVDDSLTTRMLEKSLLEAAGYNARLASSGSQALQLLQEENFDLVIVDFEMPEMSGVELAKAIRMKQSHADIPIIMLTSLADKKSKQMGLDAGVQAYLLKGSFDQAKFLKTVKRLVDLQGVTL